MRGTWKTVIALGGALALAAAAGAQQRPEANDISAADAIKYATQVYEVAKIVENQYIRPVTAPTLVAAAASRDSTRPPKSLPRPIWPNALRKL